jgi:Domain of unknown function (DUF4351)
MPNPPRDSRTPDKTASSHPATKYDTPWKIALEQHFQAFMAFYFPEAHTQIDWAFPYEFLDKELQAIAKHALVGTRHVDKLVKVRRLSGQEEWICLHVEIQVAREKKFSQRMFVYNYRLFDRYQRPIASMAVLGDNRADWLPQSFGYNALGCKMDFSFPVAKLAHYTEQEAQLEANPNPFALLTLAYLHTRATNKDMDARYRVKCKLIRLLHARKWHSKLIRELFTVIDWMMALPPELETKLNYFVSELEEEQKMEYVTSIEKVRLAQKLQEGMSIGEQKGKQEGEQKGTHETAFAMLSRLLNRRFGNLPPDTQERIKTAPREQIEAWFDRAIDAKSLDEVFPDLAH